MLNFFSQYIRNYAQIAAPLTTMLARNKPDKLIWTETEQRAFDLLKAALVSKPILRPVDMSKDFHLFCDASLNALGCALLQYDDEANNYYVIEYASKKLLPNEKNYSIIELELYSLVYGLKKFHHYTYNSKVHVYSDHRPLVWLNSIIKHSNRLARWAILLQEYNITNTYIKGTAQSADALTRMQYE